MAMRDGLVERLSPILGVRSGPLGKRFHLALPMALQNTCAYRAAAPAQGRSTASAKRSGTLRPGPGA